jgi:uncharacterized protein YceH (UPF0502 family)
MLVPLPPPVNTDDLWARIEALEERVAELLERIEDLEELH